MHDYTNLASGVGILALLFPKVVYYYKQQAYELDKGEPTMLKKAALLFGIVFIVIGIAGFIPALLTDDVDGVGKLLGLFLVSPLHNVIHLASGAAALAAAGSSRTARLYFQIFGVVYALVTILGFIQGDNVLGLIDVNAADNLLHLVISAASLYLGFGTRDRNSVTA